MRIDPRKTAPHIMTVERDYPSTYARYTSLGPLMDKLGNGGKGISWNTQDEIDFLKKLNKTQPSGVNQGRPKIETAIDAAEVILTLAPETNGQVAVKAWDALGKVTGRDHTHLARYKEDEKSVSATLLRSHVKSSLAPHGQAWKMSMCLTMPVIPMFMK